MLALKHFARIAKMPVVKRVCQHFAIWSFLSGLLPLVLIPLLNEKVGDIL
jgi:hypothetical protein